MVENIPPIPCTHEKDETGVGKKQPYKQGQSSPKAAGITAGIVGLLFGGPFLAVIMGFGAAYASKTAGPAGRTARAIGDVGVSLYEKAVELDDQHHIVAQSKVIAKDAWVKLKEVNEEHEVVKQLSGFLSFAVGATVEFVRRHRLMEGAIAGIQGILRSVFCEDTKKES